MIVSHFYLIGYFITDPSQLNENSKPKSKFKIPNAEPIMYNLKLKNEPNATKLSKL